MVADAEGEEVGGVQRRRAVMKSEKFLRWLRGLNSGGQKGPVDSAGEEPQSNGEPEGGPTGRPSGRRSSAARRRDGRVVVGKRSSRKSPAAGDEPESTEGGESESPSRGHRRGRRSATPAGGVGNGSRPPSSGGPASQANPVKTEELEDRGVAAAAGNGVAVVPEAPPKKAEPQEPVRVQAEMKKGARPARPKDEERRPNKKRRRVDPVLEPTEGKKRSQRIAKRQEEQDEKPIYIRRPKVRVTLSKAEIIEDIIKITGRRPTKQPKRSTLIQKGLALGAFFVP